MPKSDADASGVGVFSPPTAARSVEVEVKVAGEVEDAKVGAGGDAVAAAGRFTPFVDGG